MNYTMKVLLCAMYLANTFVTGTGSAVTTGYDVALEKLEEAQTAINEYKELITSNHHEYESKLQGCEGVGRWIQGFMEKRVKKHTPKGLVGEVCNDGANEDREEATANPSLFFGQVESFFGEKVSKCMAALFEAGLQEAGNFDCEADVAKMAEDVHREVWIGSAAMACLSFCEPLVRTAVDIGKSLFG